MNNDSWIVIAEDVPAGSLSFIARGLGGQVTAVVAGPQERAEAVSAAGVDEVLWYDAEKNNVPAEAWVKAITAEAEKRKPRLVLSANLPMSRVITGAVAARLGAAITSSIMAVTLENDRVTVKRSIAEGRAVEVLCTDGFVAGMIMEGAEEAEPSAERAKITAMTGEEPEGSVGITATYTEAGGVDLSSAERVVSVGAGIGSKERIELVKELAKAFHAEVSCSLPLCDNYRWFEHSRVVGSSTQRISPRIYLAVGISGQPQHMMGVRGAKTIIAVNNDPEAPIFSKCNYGIIGDLNKILPVLTEALSKV